MRTTRNVYAIILSAMVVFVPIVGLLGIWEVIEWDQFVKYFWKAIYSLVVLFGSGLIILFINSTMYEKKSRNDAPPINDSL